MGTSEQKNRRIKKACTRFWPAIVIVGIWFLFSSPFFIRGLVPFPTKYLVTAFAPWSTSYGMPVKSASMPDVITQIYPWKKITVDSWKQWNMPLWNPYSFAGTMHAGNYQTAVFSPMNLLFLIFSQPIAWSLLILLQPLFAGLFMYLFLKDQQTSNLASTIGAVAFMFSGFLVVWMAYGTLGYAACVLPLCLFAIRQAQREKKYWALPLLSFATAFSLVSGHFQISLYVLLCSGAYMGYEAMVARKWRLVVAPLLFLLLGIMMAAPVLWETMRAYVQSVRSSSFSRGEIIPWQYLITLFAPDFYGNPVTRNDWFGHYAEWAGYIGVIPLLLSLVGGALTTSKNKIFFIWLSIVSILFALPTLFTDGLYFAHIPVLSTSSASRIIFLTSFSVCTLAAFGVDAISEIWARRQRRSVLHIVLPGFVFLGVYWIVLTGIRPFAADKLSIAIHNSLLPTILLLMGMVVIAIGLYVPKKYRTILLAVLIMICAFDSLRFASKWMPFEPGTYLYPSMPVIEKMLSMPDRQTTRVFGNIGNEFTGMFQLQGLEGYDAVYKKRYGEFVSALTDGKIGDLSRSVVQINKHGIYTEKFMQLMGVGYYMHKVSDGRFPWAYPFWEYDHYTSLWHDGTYELFRNTAAFPRAYLVSSYRKITDDASIIPLLFSDEFDRKNSVILEEDPLISPKEGQGEVVIQSYNPEQIIFRVHTTAPKLLFLSDVYDAGWHAYINGKESKIYRADYVMRAVGVSAGEATVIMKYEPDSIRYGVLISVVAILAVAGYMTYHTYYAHRIL